MRDEPFQQSNFRLEVDGIPGFGVSEIAGLAATAAVMDYRVGSEGVLSARKLPGLVRYDDLVLRRGIDGSDVFATWWRATEQGTMQPRNLSIVLLDEARKDVVRWNVVRAWPRGYAVGPLIADTSGVAIETLTIAHEGFTVEPA